MDQAIRAHHSSSRHFTESGHARSLDFDSLRFEISKLARGIYDCLRKIGL